MTMGRDKIVSPRVRDLDQLAAQLSVWLASKVFASNGVQIANLSYPSGAGMSHETILFDASWDDHGGPVTHGMVVRVKPTANQVFCDDLFDEQYRIMQLMFEKRYVPVAEPLWLEQDASVLGASFFVMRKLQGRVPVSRPPYAQEGWIADASPAQRRKLWESGIRTLASIALVPLEELTFLAGPEGARSGLEQEWDKYVRFVAWLSAESRSPVLNAALSALRERWPQNQPRGPVWGGAELVNMMFDESFEVIGVMDWEQPSLGGPLNDLAWWNFMSEMKHGAAPGRAHLEGMGTREETISLWGELTGLPTDDIEWYEDFMALKIACLSVSMARMHAVPPPDLSGLASRLRLQD